MAILNIVCQPGSSLPHNATKFALEALSDTPRLEGPKPLPFTLPPKAVLKKVIHALEARRPKARYGVTFPMYLFAVLRRVLPVRVLDQILSATSNGGRR